jgi:hypothetical protein
VFAVAHEDSGDIVSESAVISPHTTPSFIQALPSHIKYITSQAGSVAPFTVIAFVEVSLLRTENLFILPVFVGVCNVCELLAPVVVIITPL